MYSKQDYNECFKEGLGLNDVNGLEDLEYNKIPEWDSVGHMTLIAAVEDKFKINFETDDIIEFSGYQKGLKILEDNYQVHFK